MFDSVKMKFAREFFIGFTVGLTSLISTIVANLSIFVTMLGMVFIFKDNIKERWVDICAVLVGFILSNLLTYGILLDYIIKRSG